MSSKDEILNAIKGASIEPFELKKEDIEAVSYKDKLLVFKDALKSVGAKYIEIRQDEIEKKIEQIYKGKRIFSFLKEFETEKKIKEPKELKDTDVAIVKGEFGVCENGAIYCDDIEQRALFFIAKTLIILLDKNSLVDNMHEAYKKISNDSNFGVFISGPSKTADIEQSLVIGAHGSLELLVLMC